MGYHLYNIFKLLVTLGISVLYTLLDRRILFFKVKEILKFLYASLMMKYKFSLSISQLPV